MKSPVQALLWELYRTSRVEFAIRMVGMVAFITLLLLPKFWLQASENDPIIQPLTILGMLFTFVGSVFSMNWLGQFDNRSAGFRHGLCYAKPITTLFLVSVTMGFTVAFAMVSCIVSLAVLRIGLGIELPLLGPALIVAAGVSLVLAAVWSFRSQAGKFLTLVGLGLIWIALLIAFQQVQGIDNWLSALAPQNFGLSAGLVVGTLSTSAISWLITWYSVSRQRFGEGLPGSESLQSLLSSLRQRDFGRSSIPLKPFSNQWVAQVWYEYRSSGLRTMLVSVASPLIIASSLLLVGWVDPHWNAAPNVWLIACVFSPLAYQLLATSDATSLQIVQGRVRMAPFQATRPMRNDQLIMGKLAMVSAVSLLGWSWMVLAAWLFHRWHPQPEAWSKLVANLSEQLQGVTLSQRGGVLALGCVVYLATAWVAIAFSLLINLFRKRMLVLAFLIYGNVLLAFIDRTQRLSLEPLWTLYAWIVPPTVIVVCLACIWKAVRTGSLGVGIFACCLCLWGLGVLLAWNVYREAQVPFAIPWEGALIAMAVALVPLASPAIATLTWAAHRHGR